MEEPVVLTFDDFWNWLLGHPNCILSVGTPEAALYDHEDFHWHFDEEGEGGELLVQVVRGKLLIGELVIPRGAVTHVEGRVRDEQDVLFECFVEAEGGPLAAYYFNMVHGIDESDERTAPRGPVAGRRWVH